MWRACVSSLDGAFTFSPPSSALPESRLKSLAVNCTARPSLEEDARRQWKPWAEAVRHRSAVPQRRLLFEMCVLAVPDRRREPQTTEGRTQEPLRDLGPNIIAEQEFSFTATAERETVRDVKEKLRFTSLDYDTELTTNPTNSQTKTSSFASVARKRCSSQSHWHPIPRLFFLESDEV